ncbi:serine hydrolase domain-containing protein [Winogradskyella forsetii]|uniref:serine hydrolase domain-containing protein n=1 Tax=Winogradskyella forsetii TaxID=2686077 RepID=UPI0015BD5377|nr:serine hydrolase domain-containing protein [Winogradskyella forsetii]
MYKNLFTAIILFLQAFSVISQNRTASSNTLLNDLVKNEIAVGAAGSYSINGVVTWETASGYADLENKEIFTLDTQIRTASIAKSMTAVAVMQLAEHGLIDINLPIDTYIPEFIQKHKTKITTKHILSHTSGIRAYRNESETENQINYTSLFEAYEVFKNRKLFFEPGTKYSYTSYGYVVLGLLIEKVSGLSYEAYMQKYIWDKAEMTHTGIEKREIEPKAATKLYHRDDRGNLKKAKPNNLSNRVPGGGFYSTVNDLIKFGNALINHHFISEETFSLMIDYNNLKNVNSRYGLGFRLYGDEQNKNEIIGHSGSQTGTSTQLFVIPNLKTVVVVVANTSGSSSEVSKVARELIATSQQHD